VCRTITAELPSLRVVALSLHEDSHVLMGILKAGAQGYVLKNSAFQELAAAIHAVAGGQKYVSPALSSLLIGEALKPASPASAGTLNEREQKIVKWLSEGWTSKQIAAQLGVSIKTVDTQRRQIMERLKIDSIAELTKYAVREGLTTLNSAPPQSPPQA
jgi:DNA-binding NarL/FixJ family response regulator